MFCPTPSFETQYGPPHAFIERIHNTKP
jgi:hypothetical protein